MAQQGNSQRQGQGTTQKPKQKPSQMPRDVATLMVLSTDEVNDRIHREVENNPFLQVVGPEEQAEENGVKEPVTDQTVQADDAEKRILVAYVAYCRRSYPDEDRPVYEPVDKPSLSDHLHEQVGEYQLNDTQLLIADEIIGSINAKGLLESSTREIAQRLNEDLGYDTVNAERDVEPMLRIIQQFDPPGIAARDPRECLLLQLRRYGDDPSAKLLTDIIENDYEAFLHMDDKKDNLQRLCNKFKITPDQLRSAIKSHRITVRPASRFWVDDHQDQLIVDFQVEVTDDERIILNALNTIDELRLTTEIKEGKANRFYTTEEETKTFTYWTERGKHFILVLKKRQEALMRTMEAIVQHQREYFLTGNETDLKPLTLSVIAKETGVDQSVVSRATRARAFDTPYGVKPIRFFFRGDLGGNGTINENAYEAIRQIIAHEDHDNPLSDEQIKEKLIPLGITISRRTVAKYRDAIGIPAQQKRKRTCPA